MASLWVLAASLGLSAPAAAEPNAEAEEQAIVISGERPAPPSRPITGSRVPGGQTIGFQAVATDTGVAGLTPGSGMDPGSAWSRTIVEVECRSDDPRLSRDAACALAPVQQMIAAGQFAEARAALDRFFVAPGLADHDRYVAARLWYALGEASGDGIDRDEALAAMLDTEAMPAPERHMAMRTLIARALARNDRSEALRMLERLVPVAPADARSHANLAALYAAEGRRDDADALIARAIAIVRARGEEVPGEWLAFAASDRP